MSCLRTDFSEIEGVIQIIQSLSNDPNVIRVVIKPESLDGDRLNNHIMLNIDDDSYVSFERYYSVVTTFSDLSKATNKHINSQNMKSFYGEAITFSRFGMGINTVLREIAHIKHSYPIPQSLTICRNKLRVDYDWAYISGFNMTDGEENYKRRIVNFLLPSMGSEYKIGNYRSQAMRLTDSTKSEERALINALEENRRGRWIFHSPKKLLFHNKMGYRTEYSFDYNYEIIADGAFNSFYNIEQITLPDSVQYIGSGCFSRCVKLKNIHLSSNLRHIGPDCFSDCTSLQQIIIPNSVTEIESLAFLRCASLSQIVMSNNLQYIGWNVFEDCPKNFEILINRDFAENLKKVLYVYVDHIVIVDNEYIMEIRKKELKNNTND